MEQSKIIAVDFDGTLCTNNYPAIGDPVYETIEALKAEQIAGARVILWTCRVGERLEEALLWCGKYNIEVAEVNRNLPDIIEIFGGDCRKIFAHEYWDDRAVRRPMETYENTPAGEIRKDSLFIAPVRKLCMSAILVVCTVKFIKWVW